MLTAYTRLSSTNTRAEISKGARGVLNDSPTGKYPRADEIALGVVDGEGLLVVNRVTTSSVGAQHHYVNYTMCWSGI